MKSWTSPVMNGLAIRAGSERIYSKSLGLQNPRLRQSVVANLLGGFLSL
jgi:hypothetical protein